MEIPVLQGRYLTPLDTFNSEPVVVIDSDLARAYFGDRNPVGQPIEIPHWGTARIVGVVGHVRHWGLDDANLYTQNQIYASFYQLADAFVPVFTGDMTFVVRTPLDPATVLPAIKAAVYGAGGGQPVYNVQTMRQIVDGIDNAATFSHDSAWNICRACVAARVRRNLRRYVLRDDAARA